MKNIKTKLLLALTPLWAVLVGVHESGLLDILPFSDGINSYIKFFVPLLLIIGNTIFIEPAKVKEMLTK